MTHSESKKAIKIIKFRFGIKLSHIDKNQKRLVFTDGTYWSFTSRDMSYKEFRKHFSRIGY